MNGETYAEGAAKIVWIDLATGRPRAAAGSRRRAAARAAADAAERRARRALTRRTDADRAMTTTATALAAVAGAHRARANITASRAGSRRATGAALARLRGAVALVGRRQGGVLARGVGLRRRHRRRAATRTLVDGDRMPGARWFPDARLNFAENLLARRAGGRRRRRAGVLGRGQGRAARDRDAELLALVSRVAAGARRARASAPATASPRTCPTCPRRSSRCSAPRASARSGRRARRTSACRACSTASARSSRGALHRRRLLVQRQGAADPRQGRGDRRRSCRRSSASSSCPTCSRRGRRGRRPRGGARRASRWDAFLAPHRGAADRLRARCRSTIRSTSCTRRARPACPSASSTAPAARCCST